MNYNKRKILFLASNPVDSTRLRLEQEYREIYEGLKRANKRDLFELTQIFAVRIKDFRRAILDNEPNIIHFSGHGQHDGIILEDENGISVSVSGNSIANLFSSFPQIECVILNSCYSEIQADSISKYVNYVIGMNDSINDKDAIEFAIGFYDSIGAGKNYETAYNIGKNCLELSGLSGVSIPILKKKSDLNHEKELIQDEYYDYLVSLITRVDDYLSQKIIVRDPLSNAPSSINLITKHSPNNVQFQYEKEVLDPFFLTGGILDKEEVKTYESFEAAFKAYNGRILLLGPPGAGKTITLLNFAKHSAIQRLTDDKKPIPVLNLLSTWRKDDMNYDLSNWLDKSFGTPPNIDTLYKEGKLLLLFDALDEMESEKSKNESEKDTLQEQFLRLIPENNKIVLTSRVFEYKQLDEKAPLSGAVTIMPLNKFQIKNYLSNQPKLYGLIKDEKNILRILENPLFLSFFSFGFFNLSESEQKKIIRLSSTTPEIKKKIFKAYVIECYAHEANKRIKNSLRKMSFSRDNLLEYLGNLTMKGLSSISSFFSFEYYFDDFLRFLTKEQAKELIDFCLKAKLLIPVDTGVSNDFFSDNPKDKPRIILGTSEKEWVDKMIGDYETLNSKPGEITLFNLRREYSVQFPHLIFREFFSRFYVDDILLKNEETKKSIHTALMLQRLDDERAIDIFIQNLDNHKEFEPIVSAHEYMAQEGSNIATMLFGGFPEIPIISQIAQNQFFFRNPIFLEKLHKQLNKNDNNSLKIEIIRLLGELKALNSVPFIQEILNSEDERLVAISILSLGDILQNVSNFVRYNHHEIKEALKGVSIYSHPNKLKFLHGLPKSFALSEAELALKENYSRTVKKKITKLLASNSMMLKYTSALSIEKIDDSMIAFDLLYKEAESGNELAIGTITGFFMGANSSIYSPDRFDLRTERIIAHISSIDINNIIRDNLLNFVNDSQEEHQFAAIQGLRYFKTSNQIEQLLIEKLKNETRKKDSNLKKRFFLLETIGMLKCKSAINYIIKLLKNEKEENNIRVCSAWSLGKIGDSKALRDLSETLTAQKNDNHFKSILIESIGEIGDESSLQILTKYLIDDSLTGIDEFQGYTNKKRISDMARAAIKKVDTERALEILNKHPEKEQDEEMDDLQRKIFNEMTKKMYNIVDKTIYEEE